MEHRVLGKTGSLVDEIGLGCEGLIGRDDALTNGEFALAVANGEGR